MVGTLLAAGGQAAPATNAVAVGTPGVTPIGLNTSSLADVPAAIRPIVEEGFFEMRVDNKEGAAAAFRKALASEPTCKQALFGLGTVLIAGEKYAEAIQVLQRALQSDPKDYFARNNLAWLYATAKDVKFRDGRKAVALAQDALMVAPQDYHVWSCLAEGYYISGNYSRAQRAAEEALRLAQTSNVETNMIVEYTTQAEKCRNAAKAMDILE